MKVHRVIKHTKKEANIHEGRSLYSIILSLAFVKNNRESGRRISVVLFSQ